MDPIEVDDSDNCTESEMLSISDTTSEDENSRTHRRGIDSKNKMKLRSIKLSRLPSLRSCIRPRNYAASSEQSTTPPIQTSDTIPNYTKATTCSDARKESFQKSAGMFSFKAVKSMTRLSSMKFKRPSMRKSSGGTTDLKKKSKKTRSMKIASVGSSRPEESSQYDQLSIDADVSSEYSKAHSQASTPRDSESSFTSNDQNRRIPNIIGRHSDSYVKVVKKATTLRPQRILTKTASLKSKRSSTKKLPEVLDSNVERATCSSTLKGSKLPRDIKVQPGGSEPERNSAVKVCPYSYCSLHGHRHGNLPPLKRFVSMRRRSLKNQKGSKTEVPSVAKAKRSSNRRKGTQAAEDNTNTSVNEKVFEDINAEVDSHGGEGKHEEVPVGVEVHQDVNADTLASLEVFKGDFESNIKVLEVSTTARAIGEEKNEDSDQSNGFLEGSSSSGDSTPNCCSDESDKTRMGKPKNMRFWGLIYQHMLSGITAEDEIQLPLDAKDKEEHVNNDHTLPQMNESNSGQSFSETEQDIGMSGAIKLVQEAFDKILSEIPDQSSDEQSISSDITSEQELSEKNHGEAEEWSISSSFDCTKDSIAKDPDETQLEAVNVNTLEEEKAASKEENKSSQNISKGWSNLKKIIILKRFVKSLEKVRDFNPRKPRFLPVEPDPEAEKVNLRRQSGLGRKNTDEWMLDYALRQVISTLAPAQKRKVALLVQAFETVTPLPEVTTPLRSNSTASSHAPPVQACDVSLNQNGEQNNSVLLGKASYPEMSSKETLDQVNDLSTAEQHIPETRSEIKERNSISGYSVGISASETTQTKLKEEATVALKLANGNNNSSLTNDQSDVINFSSTKLDDPRLSDEPSSKPDDTESTCYEEFPENGMLLPEAPKEEILTHDSEVHDHDANFNSEKLVTGNLVNAAGDQSPQPKSSTPEIYAESENNSGLLGKASYPEMSFKEKLNQVSDLSTAEKHIPETCSELEDTSLISDGNVGISASETTQTNLKKEAAISYSTHTEDEPDIIHFSSTNLEDPRLSDKPSSKPDDTRSTCNEEFPVNGKFLPKVHKEEILINDSEVHDRDANFNSEKLETGNLANADGDQSPQPKSSTPETYLESTAVCSVVPSDNPKNEVLQELSPQEESEPNNTADMAEESKLEKQKYTRLWYIIYKHMVSSNAEGGIQPLLEDGDKEEQGGIKECDSCKDFSEMNQKTVVDNQNASSQKIECHQTEAIKLIEEAIDEIDLPETQDELTGDESISGNTTPEQELKKKHGEGEELLISTSTDSAEESFRESNHKKEEQGTTLEPSETCVNSNNITAPEESETVSKWGNKSKPQMQKGWSNLKKLILLKRFFKAMEKVKKINPREPRYFPLDPDAEAERVKLRHQNSEDRKNAEEWMLDYALQRVVAKLTPERKRKVELLVEAFETVTPTLEVRPRQRHSVAASPHAKLIHV